MENKVTKEIFNPINENIKKLESLFPGIVKDGQVDFEALKQELGQFEEVGKEKYELTWPGKTQAKQLANTDIIGRTLKFVPEDSKNPKTTENLYIEGDNLEVLKLLRNSYYGKIKMIYIDPPYNTGNDFVYKDNFTMETTESEKIEGNIDEEGNRLIKNQEGSGRFHSNWLNMMYPRLKIAKDLLKEDGVIFISIDDNEVQNLRKICDEIFGEDNFVNQFTWVNNITGRQISGKGAAKTYESILVYSKNIYDISEFTVDIEFAKNNMPDTYKGFKKDVRTDEYGEFAVGDTLYNHNRMFNEETRPNLVFSIFYNPNTGEIIPGDIGENKGNGFIELLPHRNNDGIHKYHAWRWSRKKIENESNDLIVLPSSSKGYEIYTKIRSFSKTLLKDLITNISNGDSELKQLFNNRKYFDYPKSVDLIKTLIASQNGDIIMDFFSGSATTAHAVMQLNAEDRGNRKFIMVQLPESCDEKSEAYKAGYKNICEIGKERIRRSGEKIKEDFKDKEGIDDLDIGFKVFKVADTNIRWNGEALKEGQITMEESALKNKDLIDFNPGFTDIDVVYEIMLRHRDFPLTSKIEKLSNIGERTYIFADAIVVCLEEKVTDKIVDGIAAIEPKPIKVIFRDSAFDDDISLKLNTMNRLDAQLKKHNQGKEQSYRVEFI